MANDLPTQTAVLHQAPSTLEITNAALAEQRRALLKYRRPPIASRGLRWARSAIRLTMRRPVLALRRSRPPREGFRQEISLAARPGTNGLRPVFWREAHSLSSHSLAASFFRAVRVVFPASPLSPRNR